MSKYPLDKNLVNSIVKDMRVDMENASIRQVNLIVQKVEKELGIQYIRMEFGVPGLRADQKAYEYECYLMHNEKVNSDYPPFNGTERFRTATSRFINMFLNVDIPPEFIVATCGAQQGGFLSLLLTSRTKSGKSGVVFLDPGFSVNKLQVKVFDINWSSIDMYERGSFIDKLEEKCKKGNIGSVLWSSPNNPSWIVLSQEELKRIGEILTKYDVIAIEDAAYLGMDFRKDYSKPGHEPYIPTIAKYTDNYIILLSSSKIFNYAGQRVGSAVISPVLGKREFENFPKYFAASRFIDAFVQGGIYPTTSGVAHSSQLAVAHLMNQASEGRFNFVAPLRIYGERAAYFKKIMIDNGFKLVYDKDGNEPLADGFYFTVSYPGLKGPELLQELLYYGISVTTLNTFGSLREEGIRICVSLADETTYNVFRERIEAFANDHRKK